MKEDNSFRSSLAAEFQQYISLKQALGRGFEDSSRILLKLDRFLCKMGKATTDLTAEAFVQWCRTMDSLSPGCRRARMRIIMHFCLYRQRTNLACFVPDPAQFPKSGPTVQPYIFSGHEVARLLSHSACIPNSVRSPMRETATRLAIILLYSTGLRRGELLRLSTKDYDASTQTLLIRSSKFHKSRLLPLPSDVAAEVTHFLKILRAIRPPIADDTPLLWSPYGDGRPYSSTQLTKNLHVLFKIAGIKKADGRLPRVHDFRFSFAVNAIVRWYRNGVDVQAKLPFLSIYMGHVSILSTYYYLNFIEPLRSLASSRFAKTYGELITTVPEYQGGSQ